MVEGKKRRSPDSFAFSKDAGSWAMISAAMANVGEPEVNPCVRGGFTGLIGWVIENFEDKW
jgi:hypothetical protein